LTVNKRFLWARTFPIIKRKNETTSNSSAPKPVFGLCFKAALDVLGNTVAVGFGVGEGVGVGVAVGFGVAVGVGVCVGTAVGRVIKGAVGMGVGVAVGLPAQAQVLLAGQLCSRQTPT